MEDLIKFDVEDREGNVQTIELPSDINLSLMEVLKASEYSILATCGGMALCATCHVEVKEGIDELGEPTDAELDRSEEHTSELQSRPHLVCRLLLEKKKKKQKHI